MQTNENRRVSPPGETVVEIKQKNGRIDQTRKIPSRDEDIQENQNTSPCLDI